jgi:hypothetical protein
MKQVTGPCASSILRCHAILPLLRLVVPGIGVETMHFKSRWGERRPTALRFTVPDPLPLISPTNVVRAMEVLRGSHSLVFSRQPDECEPGLSVPNFVTRAAATENVAFQTYT